MSEMIMQRLDESDFPHGSQHIVLQGGHSEHHDHFDQVVEFLDEYFTKASGERCVVAG